MDKAYYYKYFEFERKHWWFRVREKILMDNIRKVCENRPLKILNIGCATGRSSEALAEFGNVTSVEYDRDCCEFIKEKIGLEVINGSILELPFDDSSFDLICAFDVIEHVEDDTAAVKEMERVCKKGGLIFVSVPAFMSLWSQHDEINHHFRRYKKAEVRKLFSNLSGNVVKGTYFNSFLFPAIYLVRQMGKVFPNRKNNKKSDFELVKTESMINKIPYIIFSIERAILKTINFPVGVSYLQLWKKL